MTSSISRVFQIGAIRAGDVVFVYGGSNLIRRKVMQFINVIGQRILESIRRRDPLTLTLRLRRYSHVMLGMDGGLVIHVDGKSVAVEVISDALHFDSKEPSSFQIYRCKDLSRDQADKIVKSAVRYYSQRYSFFTFFRELDTSDTTQLCSRLVAHAYRSAGVFLTSLPDNRVLPVHLYQICQSNAWLDISADVVQEAVSREIDKLFPPVEISGERELSMSEFFARADALVREGAELTKQTIALQRETTRNILRAEALLAQFALRQFDLSRHFAFDPLQ